MNWKDILREEIKKEIDTDYGMLRAYWNTVRRIKKMHLHHAEITDFLRHVAIQWGQIKAADMRGDFIDSRLIKN